MEEAVQSGKDLVNTNRWNNQFDRYSRVFSPFKMNLKSAINNLLGRLSH